MRRKPHIQPFIVLGVQQSHLHSQTHRHTDTHLIFTDWRVVMAWTMTATDTHLIFTDWRVVMAWTMTATDTDQFITVKLGGGVRDGQAPLVLTC